MPLASPHVHVVVVTRRTSLLPAPSASAVILILPTEGMNPQRTL